MFLCCTVELSQLLGFVSDMVVWVVGCFGDFGCDGVGTRGCYGDKVLNMMYLGFSTTVYATCLVRHLKPDTNNIVILLLARCSP